MKSFLTCLIFSVVLTSSIDARPIFRLIHDSPDHLILEARAEKIEIEELSEDGEMFSVLDIQGFKNQGEAGAPAVPLASKLIAIPEGTRPKITILKNETKTIHLPNQISFYRGTRQHCNTDNRLIRKSQLGYASFRNDEVMTLTPLSRMGPINMSMIRFSPARLSRDFLTVKLNTSVIVRIDFVKSLTGKTQARILSAKEHSYYSALTINKAGLPPVKKGANLALLVMPEKFKESSAALIKYFEARKYEVATKYITETTSAYQIKRYIKRVADGGQSLNFVLLVGGIMDLPSFKRFGFSTDVPYSNLDKGNLPDLVVSRLPVATNEELKNLVQKFQDEKLPNRVGAFLLSSGFESGWCNENIRDAADKIFAKVEGFGTAKMLLSSKGQRTKSFLHALREDPSVVIYDGHGSKEGLTEIPFLRDHLKIAKNKTPFVLVSLGCSNATLSSSTKERGFAERLLVEANPGASALVSVLGEVSGHSFLQHLLKGALYDDQDERSPRHLISDLGRLYNFALARNLETYSDHVDAVIENNKFVLWGNPLATFQ